MSIWRWCIGGETCAGGGTATKVSVVRKFTTYNNNYPSYSVQYHVLRPHRYLLSHAIGLTKNGANTLRSLPPHRAVPTKTAAAVSVRFSHETALYPPPRSCSDMTYTAARRRRAYGYRRPSQRRTAVTTRRTPKTSQVPDDTAQAARCTAVVQPIV